MKIEFNELVADLDELLQDALKDLFADAKGNLKTFAGDRSELNRSTLEFIRDGADQGERHRMLYSAAANLAELGCSLRLASALLTDAALDSGLPPADVRRAIENGINNGGLAQ